ncbi:class I SAM-dependent methyltransferase [Lysobacter sp. CA196]|uniref:class I SAM-dependent methyltransferase n=1 Tax=Lysobacter sp. CA196 TaxID=3455606 RepID=UPI003F8D39B4
MTQPDRNQREYWNSLAGIDPDAAIIDPLDRRGQKNAYLAGIRNNAFLRTLERNGIESGRLLDLGCGTGSSTRPLLDAGYAVLGVDIAPDLLRHARARCGDENCLFVAMDGKQLPLADASVDAVVVYVVLSYLTDDGQASTLLKSIRNALKPGGSLIMIEQARRHRRVTEKGLKVQRTRKEWQSLLRSAGFASERSSVLRHGRFPTTPLIAMGLLPRSVWPAIRTLEAAVARITGVLPWDYAEVLFEAKA